MLRLAYAYIAIAVLTFGYAAANHKEQPRSFYSVSAAGRIEAASAAASAAAFAWPLYWSWVAFDAALSQEEDSR